MQENTQIRVAKNNLHSAKDAFFKAIAVTIPIIKLPAILYKK